MFNKESTDFTNGNVSKNGDITEFKEPLMVGSHPGGDANWVRMMNKNAFITVVTKVPEADKGLEMHKFQYSLTDKCNFVYEDFNSY